MLTLFLSSKKKRNGILLSCRIFSEYFPGCTYTQYTRNTHAIYTHTPLHAHTHDSDAYVT